ncbi:c-type cytochrome [Aestuariivirga litoralis]|uniref:c-type cytochrome n=1 Tax=Aestuariivirga litoralis TaxID=2650924 RepID=UPI0018C507BE|nr:cytochrome c family protein [Aestuariivirga litoralis]MBG1231387.1 cytochrome c family protein [Aestuariivirga litoralis]
MKNIIYLGFALIFSATAAHADGDAVKGEQVAKMCEACHSFTDKTNKVGPSLVGVFGRKPASFEGFAYSDGFKKFGESTAAWDDATLDAYLKAPMVVVPGTKMAFGGVKNDAQRADLIAFIKTKQ